MILEIVLVSAAILLGSFTQGLTGFGLALVSVPLLSLMLSVKVAVPLAGLFGWLVTFPIVWKMRRDIHWKTGLVLVVGSLPGSYIGAELLKRLPSDVILVAMGLVLVVSAAYALMSSRSVMASAPHPLSLGVGFLSGALGASVGEPGPPAIAYTSLLPWTADEAKSTLVFFFMLQMVGAIASFYHKGLLTEEVIGRFLWALPTFAVGLALGMTSYGLLRRYRINYHHIVHGFLAVIGVVLIVKHV